MARLIIKLDGSDIYTMYQANAERALGIIGGEHLEIHVNDVPVWASDGLDGAIAREHGRYEKYVVVPKSQD